MSQFLDGRTSQNASYANSINIPTTSDYVLFGIVGLNVGEASPTAIIRVQFDGIISFQVNAGASGFANKLEIKIVRGSNPNSTAVFTGIKTLVLNGSELGAEEYAFSASDYNVPKGSGFLTYSVYVRNITATDSDVRRVGPESFNASAIG